LDGHFVDQTTVLTPFPAAMRRASSSLFYVVSPPDVDVALENLRTIFVGGTDMLFWAVSFILPEILIFL
jgi:hypothetical protein